MEDEGGPVWETLLLGYALARLIVYSYGDSFLALVENFSEKDGRGRGRSMNLREICVVINAPFENGIIDVTVTAQAIQAFGSPPGWSLSKIGSRIQKIFIMNSGALKR